MRDVKQVSFHWNPFSTKKAITILGTMCWSMKQTSARRAFPVPGTRVRVSSACRGPSLRPSAKAEDREGCSSHGSCAEPGPQGSQVRSSLAFTWQAESHLKFGCGSQPMGSHFGFFSGAPPILEPMLVGIGTLRTL